MREEIIGGNLYGMGTLHEACLYLATHIIESSKKKKLKDIKIDFSVGINEYTDDDKLDDIFENSSGRYGILSNESFENVSSDNDYINLIVGFYGDHPIETATIFLNDKPEKSAMSLMTAMIFTLDWLSSVNKMTIDASTKIIFMANQVEEQYVILNHIGNKSVAVVKFHDEVGELMHYNELGKYLLSEYRQLLTLTTLVNLSSNGKEIPFVVEYQEGTGSRTNCYLSTRDEFVGEFVDGIAYRVKHNPVLKETCFIVKVEEINKLYSEAESQIRGRIKKHTF